MNGLGLKRIDAMKLRSQSGVVLLISMVMLLLLTLIGITGMRVSSLEEKMAGNTKEINLTFQAAETTLRGVEAKLGLAASPEVTFKGSNGKGYYGYDNVAGRWESLDWDATDSIAFPLSSGGVSGAEAQFIVEEMPAVASSGGDLEAGKVVTQKFYRVTTHALGPTDTSVVELQSVYKR